MRKISKSDVMKDAHKLRRQMKRLGDDWDFARCLRYAWAKAKGKRELEAKNERQTSKPRERKDVSAAAQPACHRNCHQGRQLGASVAV
jgi:hypothetical protein